MTTPTPPPTTPSPTYAVLDGSTLDVAHPPILPFSISVEGLEGTGKTYFSLLTCPTPIVMINFGDRDPRHYLYSMPNDRRAKVRLINFHSRNPGGWTRQEAAESLSQLTQAAQLETADGRLNCGTFIIDSGSTWWQAVQEVHVAPLEEKRIASGEKQTGGLIYGRANLIVSGILNYIKNQGCFLVITHTKRQRWGSDGPVPGAFDPQYNSRVPYIVEVRLDLRTECPSCGGRDCQAKGHVGRKHIGRILKFGNNTGMVGMEIENPTFSVIYSLYRGQEFRDGTGS